MGNVSKTDGSVKNIVGSEAETYTHTCRQKGKVNCGSLKKIVWLEKIVIKQKVGRGWGFSGIGMLVTGKCDKLM